MTWSFVGRDQAEQKAHNDICLRNTMYHHHLSKQGDQVLKAMRSTMVGFDSAQIKLYGCVVYPQPSVLSAMAREFFNSYNIQIFIGKDSHRNRRSVVHHPRCAQCGARGWTYQGLCPMRNLT